MVPHSVVPDSEFERVKKEFLLGAQVVFVPIASDNVTVAYTQHSEILSTLRLLGGQEVENERITIAGYTALGFFKKAQTLKDEFMRAHAADTV